MHEPFVVLFPLILSQTREQRGSILGFLVF
jgi:hypothetical protein